MRRPSGLLLGSALVCLGLTLPASAGFNIDFSFDDNGNALGNGQKIDPGVEFFLLFSITSPNTGVSHLGPTIFDSNPSGPNVGGGDEDLLVNLGNILILQNNDFPDMTGDFFDTPNDEANFDPTGSGTIVFDFVTGFTLLSLDLIDIDNSASMDIVLADKDGLSRTYTVPQTWTFDVDQDGPNGFDTLDLTLLTPQVGEGGGVATAIEDAGFNPANVVKLEITTSGSSGIDNLVFVPGPSSLLVLAGGLIGLRRRRR